MKKLLQALLIGCFALSSTLVVCRLDRTAIVAADEGYSDLIIGLRNKAQDFLRDERIRMELDIKDLQKRDLEYRADELEEQYEEALQTLSRNINKAFVAISREFIRGADKRDSDEASVEEKTLFINKMKAKAQEKIAALIKRNEEIMQNNPLNVDI